MIPCRAWALNRAPLARERERFRVVVTDAFDATIGGGTGFLIGLEREILAVTDRTYRKDWHI